MLQHFFTGEVAGEQTAKLFNEFAIAQVDNGEFIKKHQGQYPVISMTFKDLKEFSFEVTIEKLSVLIQELYQEHKNQLLSPNIDDQDRSIFMKYLNASANSAQLENSLKFLSYFLSKTYGKIDEKGVLHPKKAIILIDENKRTR